MFEAQCGIQVGARSTPANRRELLQTLEELRRKASADTPDCRCEIFEDLTESNRFLWTEWWPAPNEARAAMDSDGFRALLAAIRVLGTLDFVRLVNTRE
jgi:quinol monooxygenase YgiN